MMNTVLLEHVDCPEWQMCPENAGDVETWEEREYLTVNLSSWESGVSLRICGMVFVYYDAAH